MTYLGPETYAPARDMLSVSPIIDDSMNSAIEYSQRAHRSLPDIIGVAVDTKDLVYGQPRNNSDNPSELMQVTALLLEIGQEAASNDIARSALEIIGTYVNLNTDDHDFIFGILADSEEVVKDAKKLLTAERDDAQIREVLSETSYGSKAVKPELWLKGSDAIDIQSMRELLDADVDPKAILLCAIQSLRNLQKTDLSRPTEAYQEVFIADAFYAPLVELLGYDGIAASIRDLTCQIRLEMSGNGEFIERAKTELDRFVPTNEAAVRSIEGVLVKAGFEVHSVEDGKSSINTAHVNSVIGNPENHSVKIGEIMIHQENDKVIRGLWRVKTLGSLAWKMFQNSGKNTDSMLTPMDVIGLTIIKDDVTDVAEGFPKFVNRLMKAADVMPSPSPSRDKYVQVRGGTEYVNLVSRSLTSNTNLNEGDFEQKLPKVKEKASFNVSKMTFYSLDNGVMVPFEIQYLTEEDRRNMRVDEAAHVLYKQKIKTTHENKRFVENMKRIHGHAKLTKTRAISSKSINRGRILRENINLRLTGR